MLNLSRTYATLSKVITIPDLCIKEKNKSLKTQPMGVSTEDHICFLVGCFGSYPVNQNINVKQSFSLIQVQYFISLL